MTGYNGMQAGGPLPEIHLGGMGDAPPQQAGAAYARQARRLYIGNVDHEATEMNTGMFFNHQMRENGWAVDNDPSGVQGPDPVVSVQVNHEKSYAFVEFRSAEEATRAMGLDGIVFYGQVLKIRRPKDYVGTDFGNRGHVPGVVSTSVPDTPNKIFVGGLPSYLNDVQVMELLQTFGELRSFNLVKEGTSNTSKVSSITSSVTSLYSTDATRPSSAGLCVLRVCRPVHHGHCLPGPERNGAWRPIPCRAARLGGSRKTRRWA